MLSEINRPPRGVMDGYYGNTYQANEGARGKVTGKRERRLFIEKGRALCRIRRAQHRQQSDAIRLMVLQRRRPYVPAPYDSL